MTMTCKTCKHWTQTRKDRGTCTDPQQLDGPLGQILRHLGINRAALLTTGPAYRCEHYAHNPTRVITWLH